MSKIEPKALTESERQEFAQLYGRLRDLRQQAGIEAERLRESKQAHEFTFQKINSVKNTIIDKVNELSKSYGLELGAHKDGVMWQFHEDNLMFVPTVVPNNMPVAKPLPPIEAPSDQTTRKKHGTKH